MIKRIISLFLLASLVLTLASCGFTPGLSGDIEEIDNEQKILYNGKKYICNDLLDVKLERPYIEIGYKRSGLGSYSHYYNPDGSEEPAYIVRVFNDHFSKVYLREDIDIGTLEFEVGGSGEKIKFSEAFYDHGSSDRRTYIGNYRVKLSSTKYPSLTLVADLCLTVRTSAT